MVYVITNILALFLIVGTVEYSLTANEGLKDRMDVPKEKKRTQASTLSKYRYRLKRLLMYPRMIQRWNMFSPTVMRTEKWITADIEFFDGTSLSLFQNNDDIYSQLDRKYFEHRDQFWRKFFGRINKRQNQKYIDDFKNWLIKTKYFPEYDGRKVKSVKLWHITERSPSMGTGLDKRPKVYKRELGSKSISKGIKATDKKEGSSKGSARLGRGLKSRK